MKIKFWSDTNQQGFEADMFDLGISLIPVALYVYDIEDRFWPIAAEWGATRVY